ncbi:MAG: lactate racemase domain-containing protein [Thermoleophilia bacterium]
MSQAAWVYCGAARLPVPRADVFEPPPYLRPVADLDAALELALERPLGAPRLRELARGAASVVITVPDASRPCPSAAVLGHLLSELGLAGVPDTRIAVAVGCGLHATTTPAERAVLIGGEACERLAVFDAQGLETATVALGSTSRGAPVHIARRVAEAALVITVGVVEPHLYAGFSGGVKGVAIGCAGAETIAWTHCPAFVSAAGVTLGKLRGNPFHETLLEIAARTPLGWGVNLVVDAAGRAASVAAGAPAAAQAALVSAHAGDWLREVDGPFDVVVAGVHAPKSDSLYQASRAATYVGLAARPALADGGLLALCADLPQGAGPGPGERNFAEVLAGAGSAAELVARGLREPLGPGGQRAFVVARLLERYGIGVVGAGDAGWLQSLSHLGVSAFVSVAAAVAATEAKLGRRARVLAVADAMASVVRAR